MMSACIAGFTLSMSHSWSREPIMAHDSHTMSASYKKLASIGLSLLICAFIVMLTGGSIAVPAAGSLAA